MRDESDLFQRKAGRVPLHLIIRSTIMVLDGSWRLEKEVPGDALLKTNVTPAYDYLFNINNHNYPIHPDDLDLIRNIENDREHRVAREMQVRLISSKGNLHALSLTGRFFIRPFAPPVKEHQPTGSNLTRDELIAALGESKRAYQEQEHLFSNILKTVPGIVSVINLATYDVEFVNQNISFGVAGSAEVTSSPKHLQIIHPEDGPALKDFLQRFLTTEDETIQTIEYRAFTQNGEWEWFCVHGKVFRRDEHGVPTHAINQIQNINDLRKAMEESARMKETLAQQAKRQYEDLFMSIDQGFAIVQLLYSDDPIPVDCLILKTNPAFEKITACRNTSGKTLRELLPSVRMEWLHSLSQVVANNKANRFTVFARELAGAWYDIYAFPTGDRTEKKVAILFNDITERLRSAEVLRDRQLKLEIAQRAGRVGIWTYDPVTREGMATKELIELTGYGGASETWRLEHFLSLLDPEDSSTVEDAFEHAKQNKGIEVECRIIHPERGLKWFLIRGSYFPEEDGEHDSLMGSLIDITEQKALEEQKDQFIAVASHELKTPVTSIKAYAEILLDFLRSKRDSAHASMMERMVSQADRLTRLINDLLDTTKITSGMLHLDLEHFDLNKLIHERVEEIQRSTKHVFTINAGQIPFIHADKDRISQVINNLITNAIKYSPQASPIDITTTRTGPTITVSVRDVGVGLTEAAQQRVFERFYRVKEATHIGGLGLGLYIAHEIIRKHHGMMGVRSKPGEGSEFFFQLPLNHGSSRE